MLDLQPPILFANNVCARCGATGVPLRDEQCMGCLMTPLRPVDPVLVQKSSDKTAEKIAVREALITMWHRLRMLGWLETHKGIFIDDSEDTIAVRTIETNVPSDWYGWCKRRVER
jgi:ribosomal protein L40E